MNEELIDFRHTGGTVHAYAVNSVGVNTKIVLSLAVMSGYAEHYITVGDRKHLVY